MMLTHLSLFSGIGGLDLSAEWAGFQTVGQCEWADYPTRVLEKHWPDVPRWRDIRTLTGEDFHARTGLRTVDLISGGFPCQPFSVAGKQKGKGDDRYLWPEMLRVIRELTPRWVVGENVPGILSIAADDVCADLERIGYEVGIFDFEAAAVGAPHRRERIAFVAHTAVRQNNRRIAGIVDSAATRRESQHSAADVGGEDVADTDNARLEGRQREVVRECSGERVAREGGSSSADANQPNGEARRAFRLGEGEQAGSSACVGWWTTESGICRVAHGVPARVDRLKCLGNAVVPQQFYPIFKAIAEVENNG